MVDEVLAHRSLRRALNRFDRALRARGTVLGPPRRLVTTNASSKPEGVNGMQHVNRIVLLGLTALIAACASGATRRAATTATSAALSTTAPTSTTVVTPPPAPTSSTATVAPSVAVRE